ncbi:MAG: serine dehydratase subunit alpha family protein [Pleomorphochaeta sp.]
MKNNKEKYLDILNKELLLALGCTEPSSIAYVASVASNNIQGDIKKIIITCSVNYIKNVHGVSIPKTGGKKGIKYAIAAGIISNNADNKLNILDSLDDSDINKITNLVENVDIVINKSNLDKEIYIKLEMFSKEEKVEVELADEHTNIIKIEKNNQIIFDSKSKIINKKKQYNMDFFEILDFVDNILINEIPTCIYDQIRYNYDIGLWGNDNDLELNIGNYFEEYSKSVALTAFASESRMLGCPLPVIINSGSGNQGLVLSISIINYSKQNNLSKEKTYKALMLSNLLAIWQKQYFSPLSAFCGVVNAASALSGALTWLKNGNPNQIVIAMNNTFATLAGMYCDGAKVSCALKVGIATKLAFISRDMALDNKGLKSGEGIVKKDILNTIQNTAKVVNNTRVLDDYLLDAILQ